MLLFLTSLKRRDELRPHINKGFQSVCSKSTKITTFLFGDDLAKEIKDISEVNKIQGKSPAQVVIHVQVALAQMGKLLPSVHEERRVLF